MLVFKRVAAPPLTGPIRMVPPFIVNVPELLRPKSGLFALLIMRLAAPSVIVPALIIRSATVRVLLFAINAPPVCIFNDLDACVAPVPKMTVYGEGISTASAIVGTALTFHVVGLSQFPLVTATNEPPRLFVSMTPP